MSGQRFASWPTYNSKKVLLEDDTRLIKAPALIPLMGTWSQNLSSSNTVIEAGHIFDVSGVNAVRLQYSVHATTGVLFPAASAIYLVVDYQMIGGSTWTVVLSGPSVTSATNALGLTSWISIDPGLQVLGDIRLRVRAVGTNGAAAGGSFVELHVRYDPVLLGSAGTTQSSGNFAQALLFFGTGIGETGEDTIATTNVAAPWVTANTILVCTPAATASLDHSPDDAAVEGVTAYATNVVPGVGFDIIASSRGGTWGNYLINAVGH